MLNNVTLYYSTEQQPIRDDGHGDGDECHPNTRRTGDRGTEGLSNFHTGGNVTVDGQLPHTES